MATRNPRGYASQRYINEILSAGTVVVKNEGSALTDAISSFDFVGGGVNVTESGGIATVTVPTPTMTLQDEGITSSSAITTFNFVGAGVSESGAGSTATITIPAATITTKDEGTTLSAAVTAIDFVGPGVTASGAGATTTVTIAAGASAVVMDNLAATTYPTAPQTQGVWYGSGAKAGCTGSSAICIGNGPVASGIDSISVGHSSLSSGDYSTSIGGNTLASNSFSVALGRNCVASGDSAIASGLNSVASGSSAIANGNASLANVSNGIAMGTLASTNAIGNSIVLSASGVARTPNDTAHALAFGINAASVTSTGLGVTLNGTSYILAFAGSTPTYDATNGTSTTLSTSATTIMTYAIPFGIFSTRTFNISVMLSGLDNSADPTDLGSLYARQEALVSYNGGWVIKQQISPLLQGDGTLTGSTFAFSISANDLLLKVTAATANFCKWSWRRTVVSCGN